MKRTLIIRLDQVLEPELDSLALETGRTRNGLADLETFVQTVERFL